MKPLKRKFASSLALLVFLSATQLASAFYDPSLGRWLNRDPINELGFKVLTYRTKLFNLKAEKNLCRFVSNNPIKYWDYLGLDNPGCDAGMAKPLCRSQQEKDCRLRCCAQHDKCFSDNDCSALSWLFGEFEACNLCNATAATCIALCKIGHGPSEGPRWFCPNGPHKGTFYDDYSSVPADCWDDGKKPPTP